jgi:DNA-binding XRE family transcriptional regulator
MDGTPISPLGQRWIKVLTHPARVAILRHLLKERVATPATLATALGMPLGNLSYHVRRLHDAQQITLVGTGTRRGRLAHHYRLSNPEATAAALRRVGLLDEPARIADILPAKHAATLAHAVGELRRRREAQGISREALAARVGIKPSHLTSIETGEADPSVTTLTDIAHELGTTLGEVFTLADRPC